MNKSIQTIAIIGAGALGAMYGSMLYEMSPTSVYFIARGDRRDKLVRDGVVVNGKNYKLAVVSPEEATPVDLLIVAVKYYHLDETINDVKNVVGPRTVILSVMNGIDSEARIAAVYGANKIIYGLTQATDAVREGNAVTFKNQGCIFFGEKNNREVTSRVKRISDLFKRAGIAYEIPQDMIRSLWFKFMINVGVNQVSAVLRANYGVLQSSSTAQKLMDSAMLEVISIARALKVDLSKRDLAEWYKVLEILSPTGKTSMLQDVEAGRATEVEMLAGKVIELGKRYGISTPINQKLFAALECMPFNNMVS